MTTIRNRLLALSVTAALALSMVAGMPAASAGEAGDFVSLINGSRAAAGLPALQTHGDLAAYARRHTSEMVAAGSIFHSSNSQLGSITSGWSAMGENVGMGPNPPLLHDAFMNSSGHRANILGNYTHVGVGAERAPDGTLFVTVIFMRTSAPATTTTTAPPPTTTTTAPASPPATTAPAPTPTTTAPAAKAPAPSKAPVQAQQVAQQSVAAAPIPAPVEWKPLPVPELQKILGMVPGTYCLAETTIVPICMD